MQTRNPSDAAPVAPKAVEPPSAEPPPSEPKKLTNPAAGNALTRFLSGAQYAISGLAFTLQNKRLRTLSAVPIALNILLFAVFMVGGFLFIGEIADWAQFFDFDGTDRNFLMRGLFWVLDVLWTGFVYLAIGVGLFLGGLLATVVVGNVLAGPIYDRLSEITEELVLGRSTADAFTLKGMAREVGEELLLLGVRLSIYVVGLVPIFLINVVPGVGSAIGTVLGALWTWIFLALEIGNPSFVRHKVRGPLRVSHLFIHSAAHLGFGAASWLMLWIPVTMPFLCVGATRMHLAFAAQGLAPSRLSDGDKATLAGPQG